MNAVVQAVRESLKELTAKDSIDYTVSKWTSLYVLNRGIEKICEFIA